MRLLAPFLARIKPIVAGKERWDVKTGTDVLALAVSSVPISSTIAALIALPAPRDPHERLPAEDVIYSVPCRVTLFKHESDGDVHLVLTDESGNTMIGEIPDANLITLPSPWLAQITAARAQFIEWPRLMKPSIVTGVCFFDHAHGQDGVASNAIELHPILSITAPSSLSAVSDTP